MGFFKELKKDLTQTADDFAEFDTKIPYEDDDNMCISDDMMVNTLEENGGSMTYFDDAVQKEDILNDNVREAESGDDFSDCQEAEECVQDEYIPENLDGDGETGIISKSVVITGDVITKGSLVISGCINGNVECDGKITLTGTVKGNIQSSSLVAEGARVDGNIVCNGPAKIGDKTVVIGNINASSAVVSGAIKGDIDVHGPVVVDTSAVIVGNIKSKLFQINNGAVVEGYCSQCYYDNSPEKYFNEN